MNGDLETQFGMNKFKIIKVENFNKNIISIDSSLKEAINKFNLLKKKILLVYGKNKKFIGTITLGDFRRSIIIHKSLKTEISKIVNTKSKYLKKFYNTIDPKLLKNLTTDIKFIPVIKNNKVVQLIEIIPEKKIKIKNIPVIIMAGGLGLRMLPKTKYLPKPMIKIKGKPMLENLLTYFKKYNFNYFYFSVNYLKKKIINYFKDGKKFGVNITYLVEKKSLGTAGSLSLLSLKKIKSDNVVVINCDIATDFDIDELIEYHHKLRSDFTIVSKSIEEKSSYGELITKGTKVININEKKSYEIFINCGIYIMKKKCLKILKKNQTIDMNSFILKLTKNKFNVTNYPIIENWSDLGLGI